MILEEDVAASLRLVANLIPCSCYSWDLRKYHLELKILNLYAKDYVGIATKVNWFEDSVHHG